MAPDQRKETHSPVPPAITVAIDLESWLDPAGLGEWSVPVPRPFDVRGATIVGKGTDPEKSLDPRTVPWMVTDFADLASRLTERGEAQEPSLGAMEALVAFANEYGLPGSWLDAAMPPHEASVAETLDQAWSFHEVLQAARALTEPMTEDAGGGALVALLPFLGEVALIFGSKFETWTLPEEGGRFVDEEGLQFVDLEASVDFAAPLDLLDVMRLQLYADMRAKRRIRKCGFCHRLFVWAKPRSDAAPRRGPLPGPPPDYCSFAHAKAAAPSRKKTKTPSRKSTKRKTTKPTSRRPQG